MRSRTKFLLLMLMAIIVFSLVTIAELWVVQALGFDFVEHVTLRHHQDLGVQFYLEAFGIAAVILAQPITLITALVSIGETSTSCFYANAHLAVSPD